MKPSTIKNTIIALGLTIISDVALAKATENPAAVMAVDRIALSNNWTGAYAGVSIGGIFNDADVKSNSLGFNDINGTCNTSSDFSSFLTGLQVGYSHQFDSRVVLGIEGDFTYNFSQSGMLNCPCPFTSQVFDRFSIKNRQQGSVRGRLGYALGNNLLPFVMAGDSLADLGMNYKNEGGDYYSKSTTRSGWLAGAGIDWGFSHNWSIRVEYSYTDYGTVKMMLPSIFGLNDMNGRANVNLNANTIKASLNYWL